jgi:hypothetical protein
MVPKALLDLHHKITTFCSNLPTEEKDILHFVKTGKCLRYLDKLNGFERLLDTYSRTLCSSTLCSSTLCSSTSCSSTLLSQSPVDGSRTSASGDKPCKGRGPCRADGLTYFRNQQLKLKHKLRDIPFFFENWSVLVSAVALLYTFHIDYAVDIKSLSTVTGECFRKFYKYLATIPPGDHDLKNELLKLSVGKGLYEGTLKQDKFRILTHRDSSQGKLCQIVDTGDQMAPFRDAFQLSVYITAAKRLFILCMWYVYGSRTLSERLLRPLIYLEIVLDAGWAEADFNVDDYPVDMKNFLHNTCYSNMKDVDVRTIAKFTGLQGRYNEYSAGLLYFKTYAAFFECGGDRQYKINRVIDYLYRANSERPSSKKTFDAKPYRQLMRKAKRKFILDALQQWKTEDHIDLDITVEGTRRTWIVNCTHPRGHIYPIHKEYPLYDYSQKIKNNIQTVYRLQRIFITAFARYNYPLYNISDINIEGRYAAVGLDFGEAQIRHFDIGDGLDDLERRLNEGLGLPDQEAVDLLRSMSMQPQ